MLNRAQKKLTLIMLLGLGVSLLIPLNSGAEPVKRKAVRDIIAVERLDAFDRRELRQKAIIPKPKVIRYVEGRDPRQIIVKFVDGPRIRPVKRSQDEIARTNNISDLEFAASSMNNYDWQLMKRNSLRPRQVEEELELINRIASSPTVRSIEKLFQGSARWLSRMRQASERRSGVQHSDLSNYYILNIAKTSYSEEIINQINGIDLVETTYFSSDAVKLPDDPPVTPNFQPNQGYLTPAPTGIDAVYAWTIPGGSGEHVNIIDIEYGWITNHEDLPVPLLVQDNNLSRSDGQHGTAAVSVMVGIDDSAGVKGIVYDARVGMISSLVGNQPRNVPGAIYDAIDRLFVGDIILLEQQSVDHEGGDSYVPVEYDQADFDMISIASNLGLVVVQAAGNGGNNLDAGVYDGRFDPNFRHSGAVMVGASESNTRTAKGFSNYGARISLHGWGENVMSAGYGRPAATMRINGTDNTQWYRTSYSGTSSASPIVAGAIVALQSARIEAGLNPMGASSIEALLSSTGTAYTGSNAIGEFPNLQTALTQMLPDTQPSDGSGSSGSSTTPTPPVYEPTVSLGSVTTTAVAGVSSTRSNPLFGANSNSRALTRLKFGERSDKPCWLKGFKRSVIDQNSGFIDTEFDECKNNKGPTSTSEKFVPSSNPPNDLFIHGIEVCMSKTKNDNRIKGVKLRQSRVTSEGLVERIAGSSSGYPQFERPNCKDDWKPARLCPSNAVATNLIIHHFQDGNNARSISGVVLECQEIQVQNVCVANCN